MADAVPRTPLAQSGAGNEEPSCSGISFSARTLALKESLKKASRSPDSEIKPIEMSERKPGKDAGHRLRRRRRVRLTKISPEALISTAIN